MLWRCSTRGTAGPSGPPGSQPGALGIPALCSLMCSQPLPPQHLTRCWGHWPGATNAVHLSSGNAFSHTVFPFIPPAFFLKPKRDELALIWGSSSGSGQREAASTQQWDPEGQGPGPHGAVPPTPALRAPEVCQGPQQLLPTGTVLTSRILASFLLLFSSREALQIHS